jgi:hypothetical protein
LASWTRDDLDAIDALANRVVVGKESASKALADDPQRLGPREVGVE